MALQLRTKALYDLILAPAALLLLVSPALPLVGVPLPPNFAIRFLLALWLLLFAWPYVRQLHRYAFDLSYTTPVFVADLTCALLLLVSFLGLGFIVPGALSMQVSIFAAAILCAAFPLRDHLLPREPNPHAPAICLSALLILALTSPAEPYITAPLLAVLFVPLPYHWASAA